MPKIKSALLFLLILFLPSQLAYHIWPANTALSSVRIDYHALTIYFSDVLALFLAVFALFSNKKNTSFISLCGKFKKTYLVLGLVLLNILVSRDPLLTISRYLHIFLYVYVFVIYFSHELNRSILITSFSLSLIVVAGLGIAQFLHSGSIGGILWWIGERPLSTSSGMIATVNMPISGLRILRPYSIFPHPNALAGFLLLGIFFLKTLIGDKQEIKSRLTSVLSTIGTYLSLICIVLTLSYSAILVGILMLGRRYIYKITKSNSLLKPTVLVGLLLVLGTITYSKIRPDSFQIRVELIQEFFHSFPQFALFGTGLGAYLYGISNPVTVSGGFYQPIHNGYLLLLGELGLLVLLITFFLFVVNILHNIKPKYFLLFSIILMLNIFDHYWLTSHANLSLLMLTLVLATT